MKQLNENIRNLLENQPLWYVGTCSDEPNTAVIGFKEILDDGKLLLCDVFMKQTRRNILANGKVSIAVCDPNTMEAYQIQGTAEYLTSGESLNEWKTKTEAISAGKLVPKGIVLVTPELIKVSTPNRRNGEKL